MALVKGKNTKLEERGWTALRLAGVRFRKHPSGILGKPDAANKAKKIVFFFDSEFWHGYEWGKRKNAIKSNKKFWHDKIESNIQRDKEVNAKLKKAGWKVVRIWEKDLSAKRLESTLKRLESVWDRMK